MRNILSKFIVPLAVWAETNLRKWAPASLFSKKALAESSQAFQHGKTVVEPPEKDKAWRTQRMERNYKRAIRRLQGRGTLRCKGKASGAEKPGPNKFWNAARLEREGLRKERVWVMGRRETYLVACRGNRVLQIPNYGSITTKAA